MKIRVATTKVVEVKTLSVDAFVRYWEDADVNGVEDTMGNLIPCRDGDSWKPIIDLETGVITNWQKGVSANIHYKVCDGGNYYLKDEEGNIVASLEDDYVPKIMCPNGNGYGDYIKMDIDEDGRIKNFNVDFTEFESLLGII
jgi:hypothetical protein